MKGITAMSATRPASRNERNHGHTSIASGPCMGLNVTTQGNQMFREELVVTIIKEFEQIDNK